MSKQGGTMSKYSGLITIGASVVAAVALATGAVLGSEAISSHVRPPASAPVATAPTEGCTATATEELFVAKMSECTARSTRVYEFADTAARDNWRKAAEGFGTVVVGTGDTWLEVKA